jgi:hypothetical protein
MSIQSDTVAPLLPRRVGRDLRELAGVRIYRGRPESNRDPKGDGANLRQCTEWERGGANVITRTLRYPPGWPEEKPEEKGIDVALAMDFHAMAVRGEYDIGILMSTDTDLKPAVKGVAASGPRRHASGATGSARRNTSRLSISPTTQSRAERTATAGGRARRR